MSHLAGQHISTPRERCTSFTKPRYFGLWNVETVSTQKCALQRIYTGAYLCDEQISSQIDQFQTYLFLYIKENDIYIPDDSELVLEISHETHSWCYYFIDHASHSLFWVHECDMTHQTGELLGYPDLPHLRQSSYTLSLMSLTIHGLLCLQISNCNDITGTF